MAYSLPEPTPEQLETFKGFSRELGQILHDNKIDYDHRQKLCELGFTKTEDLVDMYRDREHLSNQAPVDFRFETTGESPAEQREKARWRIVRLSRAWATAKKRVAARECFRRGRPRSPASIEVVCQQRRPRRHATVMGR